MASGRHYDDASLIEKVRQDYLTGRARSYVAAALALALAGQIVGGGTPENKARRIAVKAAKLDKASNASPAIKGGARPAKLA
jgi:hypothetical protein